MERCARLGDTGRNVVLLVEFMVTLVGYLAVGGLVLVALERDAEEAGIRNAMRVVEENNLTVEQVHNLAAAGICKFRTLDHREWDFEGATFFALTVATTIGYGFVTPSTTGGRFFTFVYSLIGIGLVAHVLQRSTSTMLKLLRTAWHWMLDDDEEVDALANGRCGTRHLTESAKTRAMSTFAEFDTDNSGAIEQDELEAFLRALSGMKVHPLVVEYVMHEADSGRHDGALNREEMISAVTLFYTIQKELPPVFSKKRLIINMIVMTVWLMGWAWMFAMQEGWPWADGLWYCYITLSTIGFGDYHPVTTGGRFMAFLFIIPGLSIVGHLITTLFAASHNKRYWLLQNAYKNGKISEGVLRSQGIRPLSKSRPTSSTVESGKLLPCEETTPLVVEVAAEERGSACDDGNASAQESLRSAAVHAEAYTPPPAALTPLEKIQEDLAKIHDDLASGGFIASARSSTRPRTASNGAANPLAAPAVATTTTRPSVVSMVSQRTPSPTPDADAQTAAGAFYRRSRGSSMASGRAGDAEPDADDSVVFIQSTRRRPPGSPTFVRDTLTHTRTPPLEKRQLNAGGTVPELSLSTPGAAKDEYLETIGKGRRLARSTSALGAPPTTRGLRGSVISSINGRGFGEWEASDDGNDSRGSLASRGGTPESPATVSGRHLASAFGCSSRARPAGPRSPTVGVPAGASTRSIRSLTGSVVASDRPGRQRTRAGTLSVVGSVRSRARPVLQT